MHFHHLTPLLPCHALDELTSHRRADEAEQILSAWSALWHPAMVAAAHAMPRWSPAESPPQEPAGYLVLLPPCCEPLVPAGWLEEAEQAGACVLRGLRTRAEMVAAALERLKQAPAPSDQSDGPDQSDRVGHGAPDLGVGRAEIDPELVADFLALGLCHFTIELLTQHLRYMSNLDEASFERELIEAAELACKGEVEASRGRLQAAFDLLHSAREYFYPVEAHLLDLTLLAPTTIGRSLRADLALDKPVNLLVSGEVVEQMARQEPESLAALRSALENNRAAILGGEYRELELPLLPPEAIRRQFEKGLAAYERHLGVRPSVFGRRRFGITPVLPQVLEEFGFVGAMHSTLDDGRFPASSQSRVRWEGIDGTVVEAIARVPADIGRADAFLRLPQQLGNSMDLDHVATVLFAHWPGRSSPWYDDLRRITRFTTVMGTFSTVSDYFQRTGMAGQQAAHKADEYRSPYLVQAVAANQADPISRWVRYYRRRAAAVAIQTLDALSALVGHGQGSAAQTRTVTEEDSTLLDDVDLPGAVPTAEAELDQRIARELDRSMGQFSAAVGGGATAAGHGFLLANPCSFDRRLCLDVPELRPLPDVAGPIVSAAESAGRTSVVVDVPAMGFAWIAPGKGGPGPAQPTQGASPKWRLFGTRPAEPPPMAEKRPIETGARRNVGPVPEETVLRNEFFEVLLDPRSGAIRGIFDYRTRRPRLAQQIAMRLPGASGEGDDAYSTMTADEIAITSPGPVLGEAVVRGRLLGSAGRRLAGFQQTTRVWRGSRVIELDIELDVDQVPDADPWNCYYASRVAWADESANLYRSVHMANLPTEAVQLEAPHFIDVRLDKLRTTLFTAGLTYHRRIGLRRLDTLLVVRGETARRFRLGIGIDVPQPMAAALDFLAPRPICSAAAMPPTASGWLFHLGAKNVVATHWEPLLDEDGVAGFRVRLLETDGRPVPLVLRSFRAVKAAQKLSTVTRPAVDLAVEGDRITVELGGHQWVEVEARFTR